MPRLPLIRALHQRRRRINWARVLYLTTLTGCGFLIGLALWWLTGCTPPTVAWMNCYDGEGPPIPYGDRVAISLLTIESCGEVSVGVEPTLAIEGGVLQIKQLPQCPPSIIASIYPPTQITWEVPYKNVEVVVLSIELEPTP